MWAGCADSTSDAARITFITSRKAGQTQVDCREQVVRPGEKVDTRARGGISVKRDGSRERSQRGRGGGQWPHNHHHRPHRRPLPPSLRLWLPATAPPATATAPLCRSAAIDCRMTRRPCCSVRRRWLPAMAPRCSPVEDNWRWTRWMRRDEPATTRGCAPPPSLSHPTPPLPCLGMRKPV